MSDGQFPPESPQDPVNAPQTSSENLSDQPGLAPIGASTPGELPQNADEPAIDLPVGGQYPDDMFGVSIDEATVTFPEGASAEIELPLPAEPLPLSELAMDPLPAPQREAGGDMFSIDDFLEPEPELVPEPVLEQAAAAPPLAAPLDNGDMFSIDDFAEDAPEDAPGEFEPLAAEPLAVPEPLPAPEPAFEMETPIDAPPQLAGAEVANPYLVESDEASVLDSASSFTEVPEVDSDVPTQIINPYAVAADEAEVIDPAMAPTSTEQRIDQPEPEQQEPSSPYSNQPMYQDFNQGESYEDVALPATDRTVSIAPPGMDGMVVGGLVVADGGKGVKKPAPPETGKKAKRGSFGFGQKQAAASQGPQTFAVPPVPYAEEPQAAVIQSAESAAHSKRRGMRQKKHKVAMHDQKSFFGIKYGKPAAAPQHSVQPVVALPAAFPGGYTAGFVSDGTQSPLAAPAAAPSQTPEQIMPPLAQTAQANPVQAQQSSP